MCVEDEASTGQGADCPILGTFPPPPRVSSKPSNSRSEGAPNKRVAAYVTDTVSNTVGDICALHT